MPVRAWTLAILCLLLVAGCGSNADRPGEAGEDADSPAGDADDSSGGSGSSDPESSPASDGSDAAELPDDGADSAGDEDDEQADANLSDELVATESVFVELGSIIDQWRNPDIQKVGECMHDSGFPQLLESMSEAEQQYTGLGSPLIEPLHFFGPHTEEQARQAGMLGLWTTFSYIGQGVGNVMSNDPAYYSELDRCKESVGGTYNEAQRAEMEQLSAAYFDLYNSLSAQFSSAIRPTAASLVGEQMACVREAGHPILDHDLELARGREMMLESLDIELGEMGTTEPDPAIQAPLKPGETRAIRPSQMPRETYVPSPAEVEFALDFVDCGEQVDLVNRLRELQIPPRATLLAEYETQILGLQERVLAIVSP